MKPQMNTDEHRLSKLSFKINGCAMRVLNTLGHGLNEKLYENAFAIELKKNDIEFEQQKQFDVFYDEQKIGTYIPDFVIEDSIIIEMKTIEKITNHEIGQTLNYLGITNLDLGIIYNFKKSELEWKRVIRG